jgi:ArsR family transcriptional regulator, arsenate/arsenite/antimonite-responsive transcriptional repressor
MNDFTVITKALADEGRARILMLLDGQELCVCQVIEMMGLAPSTVSRHLAMLHQAGLIESRKDGRWIYYRLPRKGPRCAREAIRFVRQCLQDDERTRADADRLRVVQRMNKEALCCRYKMPKRKPK